jgi:hypothetical protein
VGNVFLFSDKITQSAKTKHDGLGSSFVRQSLVLQYKIGDLFFVCAHDSNQALVDLVCCAAIALL